jgi:hypothetical protein
MANELNRQFSKEETKMAIKYRRKCSTFLAIKEIQLKMTLRFHLTPVRVVIIKKTNKIAGEDAGIRNLQTC